MVHPVQHPVSHGTVLWTVNNRPSPDMLPLGFTAGQLPLNEEVPLVTLGSALPTDTPIPQKSIESPFKAVYAYAHQYIPCK